MRLFALAMAIAGAVVACSSSNDSTASTGSPDAGGICCPASPNPACCMSYGGWAEDSTKCESPCDGIPLPTDPSWKLAKDDHGCDAWSSRPVVHGPSDGPLCGSVTSDAGAD